MFSPIEAMRRKSQRGGLHRTFSLAGLAAGALVQYSRDHADIRGALQDYQEFNSMFIINNSDVDVAVDLDFTASKRTVVPAHMTLNIDQVSYLEFQVTNLSTTDASTTGQIVITAINERPLAREGR